jgi:predicted glycoside hydrolase/deacetylase ChbG (UPF0249 family)
MSERSRSVAELLGYSADARLLIINADDFGMCHAENVATIAGLEQGAFCSSTVMAPCPWFEEAAAFARRSPSADIGVHITHTSEWETYRWGPVAGASAVPTMVNGGGTFYADVPSLYANARLDQVERETRAQIGKVFDAGIDVTHLDSHMGTVQLDADYHALYLRLAAEFRLPIRMAGRAFMEDMGFGHIVDQANRLSVLSPDHFWYGGPSSPKETSAYWTNVLRHLRPGVNELYVHAAVDEPEMRAISDSWAQRNADYRFFTFPSTHALIQDLGVILIGYRVLRDLQRRLQTC